MKFRLPESYYKKLQEIYELKYITIGDQRIHITELEDKSVTPEVKSNMRMNSYAQDDLPPKLTDEALIDTAKYFLSQCSEPKYPCTTYNESIIHKILPEMIKRLEEKIPKQPDVTNLLKQKDILENEDDPCRLCGTQRCYPEYCDKVKIK